jgi:hypothetical protein
MCIQVTQPTGTPRDPRVIRRLLELAKDDVQQAHSCIPRDDEIAALMKQIRSELDAQRITAATITTTAAGDTQSTTTITVTTCGAGASDNTLTPAAGSE